MTFLQWIRQQKDRPDPVGDLARDIEQDRDRPRRAGLETWREHLERMGAIPAAIETLDRAWGEYLDTRADVGS